MRRNDTQHPHVSPASHKLGFPGPYCLLGLTIVHRLTRLLSAGLEGSV